MIQNAETEIAKVRIPDRMFFRIGEVASLLSIKPYVLRYWETEFSAIAPQKSKTGQRVYRKVDVETVALIKHLLYTERFSIEGAKRRIRELRSEGQLSQAKKEITTPKDSVSDQRRVAALKDLQDVAHELQMFSRTPVTRIFKY
jgi:DNA-binding transcriptional MerR regulator